MRKTDPCYSAYLEILRSELIPAMGCTEPIAVAYAASRARDLLGARPERVTVGVSGSIIKNVKSVVVPNTGHMRGIEAAACAGIVAGRTERVLEVLAGVTPAQIGEIRAYREQTPVEVKHIEQGLIFDIVLEVSAGEHSAAVRIAASHTNIVHEEKDGVVLLDRPIVEAAGGQADTGLLTMEAIWDFAMTAELEDVREVLDRQIAYNTAISREGLAGQYGANIGSVLLSAYGDGVANRAKAAAAAGSDARMNGCEMPVVINSGSGNQGITVSVPVIEYARALGATQEQLYRALLLSNLTAIHQKAFIGRLSAYCGAVNAGAGAGCGIAYLRGADYEGVVHTLVNALAIVSGIICDGAKASCAAKIASAVDAGILGYDMYLRGQQFYAGDGIVGKGVEANIVNVGRLGKDGMRETNNAIIDIMIGC